MKQKPVLDPLAGRTPYVIAATNKNPWNRILYWATDAADAKRKRADMQRQWCGQKTTMHLATPTEVVNCYMSSGLEPQQMGTTLKNAILAGIQADIKRCDAAIAKEGAA